MYLLVVYYIYKVLLFRSSIKIHKVKKEWIHSLEIYLLMKENSLMLQRCTVRAI